LPAGTEIGLLSRTSDRLSQSEQRAEIKKPVDQIEADPPDHANVRSGQPREIGDVFTTFEVHRQNGQWGIIKGSISTGPVAIITE
jgi:hypothetical protein